MTATQQRFDSRPAMVNGRQLAPVPRHYEDEYNKLGACSKNWKIFLRMMDGVAASSFTKLCKRNIFTAFKSVGPAKSCFDLFHLLRFQTLSPEKNIQK